ncbi:hypothetical protein SLA2020_407240 [Shorea laevis]
MKRWGPSSVLNTFSTSPRDQVLAICGENDYPHPSPDLLCGTYPTPYEPLDSIFVARSFSLFYPRPGQGRPFSHTMVCSFGPISYTRWNTKYSVPPVNTAQLLDLSHLAPRFRINPSPPPFPC